MQGLPSEGDAELAAIFQGWLRWRRLLRLVDWAGYGLLVGTALGTLVAGGLAWQGLLLRSQFLMAALLPGLAAMLLAGAAGYLWPLPAQPAARFFDRRFHLQERLSTAIELALPEHAEKIPTWMCERQLEDTLRHTRTLNIRRKLPIQVQPYKPAALALILFGVALLAWRGQPFFQAAANQQAFREQVQAQVSQLDELASQIEADEQLSQAQAQELTQPIQQAIAELQQAETPEQALSALNQAAEQLRQLSQSPASSQAVAQAQALKQAGEGLSQQEGSPLQATGEQLAQGDLSSAAQELQAIHPGTLTQEQAQQLAGQLSETAQAVEEDNPQLAGQLNQAAEALQRGDTEAATAALQEAAQSISEAAGEAAQAEAAAQAAGQLQQAGQQMSQSAAGGQGAQGQGDASGQGSSTGSAQGQPAGGAGRGEGDGSSDAGPAAGDTPIGQGNAPGDAGETPYQPLNPSQRLGGPGGDTVQLPSRDQAGEIITGQGPLAPGQPASSSVPYTQVYSYYQNVYRQAINSGRVPLSLRSLVRDYFSSLEP